MRRSVLCTGTMHSLSSTCHCYMSRPVDTLGTLRAVLGGKSLSQLTRLRAISISGDNYFSMESADGGWLTGLGRLTGLTSAKFYGFVDVRPHRPACGTTHQNRALRAAYLKQQCSSHACLHAFQLQQSAAGRLYFDAPISSSRRADGLRHIPHHRGRMVDFPERAEGAVQCL